MPLEMAAITTAFGLTAASAGGNAPWIGRVGNSDVTAIHIGMGPATARAATARLFDEVGSSQRPAHVMIAGICGGLDPRLDVGTLVNPEFVIEHATGATYRHTPPGDAPCAGKLITTEGVIFDRSMTQKFLEDGCLGVDMESSAVAEVCEAYGCAWSVYRCISDRPFDDLLDERIVALTHPDGSGNTAEIGRLVAGDPELAEKLRRLGHDTNLAARRAAEAAVQGCLALDR